jgi:hypothetical protein
MTQHAITSAGLERMAAAIAASDPALSSNLLDAYGSSN